MLLFCLKHALRLFVFAVILFLPLAIFVQPVFAARVITSATLNGTSSVTVMPSSAITAQVTANLTGGGGGDDWGSTSYQIGSGGVVCVDHANITSSGVFSQSFGIIAPNSSGTYDVNFIIWRNNSCDLEPSITYTLTGGIIIASPTSTPTPTPTPGPPTSTPTPTPTPIPGVPTATPTPAAPTATLMPGQPTPTPTSTGSTDSTASVVHPSVILDTYTPNPTNVVPLALRGQATIQQGTIAFVEYTYTDGSTWIPALPVDGNFDGKDEYFSFVTPRFSEGIYTIKVRAKSGAGTFTQESSYASQTITIAITPPRVILNTIVPNPTRNKTPMFTGTVTAGLSNIARVEISIDNGKSWQTVKRTGNVFSFTPGILEDNNYQIRARALDNAGNIGLSDIQTLVIDTIPPIIGGGMLAIGPQILSPDKDGNVRIVAGTGVTIAMSMKGGVTQANIHTGTDSFVLMQKEGTNIWVGKIIFDVGGKKPLTVRAIDGAGNHTERKYNTLLVEDAGVIADVQTKLAIKDANVSVYFFETVSKSWTLWEGGSYGEHNPQKTNSDGVYSFMVPAGKYYIEAKARGYRTMQSEIITVAQTSILNYTLALIPKPRITLSLPFIGTIVLTVPTFALPDTYSLSALPINPHFTKESDAIEPGTSAFNFSLPNAENRTVSIADYRGKKLVLSFIAPWSPLSLEQAPFLSDLALNLTGNQAMLAVGLQESIATMRTLNVRGNYRFPVVADRDGTTATGYAVTILPHHVFIDAKGNIHDSFTGVLTREELSEALSRIP